MIAAIRVRGQPDVGQKPKRTLNDLKLRKKNQIVIFEENDAVEGMMNHAKDYIAYGEISDETLEKLKEKKGEEIENGDVLSLTPPSGGFRDTRKQFGQGGSLGKHENLDDLVQKMV